jgi:PAS domain-containing protein
VSASGPSRGRARRRRSDARRNRAAVLAAAAPAPGGRDPEHAYCGDRGRRQPLNAVPALPDARLAGSGASRRCARGGPTRHRSDRTGAAAAAGGAEATCRASRRGCPRAPARRIGGVPLGDETDAVGETMLPAVKRLLRAVELSPSPPGQAAGDLLNACLAAGSPRSADARAVAGELFGVLTELLDQGLVILNRDGRLLSINPRAAAMLDPSGRPQPGEPLTERRLEVLYEDGPPSAAAAYPLAVAVRTKEPQRAVRGHPDGGAEVDRRRRPAAVRTRRRCGVRGARDPVRRQRWLRRRCGGHAGAPMSAPTPSFGPRRAPPGACGPARCRRRRRRARLSGSSRSAPGRRGRLPYR